MNPRYLLFLGGLIVSLVGWAGTTGASNVLTAAEARPRFATAYQAFLPLVLQRSQPYTLMQVNFAGRSVTDVLVDPDEARHVLATMYFGGLFETRDGGLSWDRYQSPTMTTRLNDLEVNAVTPTLMYLGSMGSIGVYQSSDGGQNWGYSPGWPYLYPYILSVAAHPSSPTVVFAGSGNWEATGGEIYRTDNNGETWQAVSPQYTNALSFAFHPQRPLVVYAGTMLQGVLKSTDGGNTWFNASHGLSGANVRLLAVDPLVPQRLFAGSDAGLFVSDDAAGAWRALWTGAPARALVFDPVDATVIFLGADTGLFVSYDSGAHWSPHDGCSLTPPIDRRSQGTKCRSPNRGGGKPRPYVAL
jgi:photosystem II stability/assembly factor-like uncharacterized protein